MGGEGVGWLVIVAGATNPQKKRKKGKTAKQPFWQTKTAKRAIQSDCFQLKGKKQCQHR
jgi:hypothetical protein